ncbi:hypothetical protein SIL85_19030 [Shewanella oneidensis]|uniref:hypothetical protein n=1 Tax=Shewanella oneidensis TaxID=70863 RepID=UPI001EE74E34|nr:hypothetical protein [Shewanella oneidensis]MDX5999093.1 hypothetical protein [Shewanella oneidensis]MEE2029581.1 hypothetical protein [Shewanella oneidensis]
MLSYIPTFKRKNTFSGQYYRSLTILFLLLSAWIVWFIQFAQPFDLIKKYGKFVFLGITGAIFDNSTGAGGGVIFIPVFSSLDFTEAQSVSTSFMIQCFGMTADALSWSRYYQLHHMDKTWHGFVPSILLCACFSVLGLWSASYGNCLRRLHSIPALVFSLSHLGSQSFSAVNGVIFPSQNLKTVFCKLDYFDWECDASKLNSPNYNSSL